MLFIATGGLWIFTGLMWKATQMAVIDGQNARIDLERPYIFISNVSRLRERGIDNGTAHVSYTVSNHGRLPAVITKAQVSLGNQISAKDPEIVGPWHNLNVNDVLGCIGDISRNVDAWLPYTYPFTEGHEFDDSDPFVVLVNDNSCLLLRIIIEYDGPFSKGHRTSACWKYDSKTHYFRREGGNEYNYVN